MPGFHFLTLHGCIGKLTQNHTCRAVRAKDPICHEGTVYDRQGPNCRSLRSTASLPSPGAASTAHQRCSTTEAYFIAPSATIIGHCQASGFGCPLSRGKRGPSSGLGPSSAFPNITLKYLKYICDVTAVQGIWDHIENY